MEQEGTLRTSHREQRAVKRKIAPRGLGDRAREAVNAVSQHGPIVRQRLDIERMKQPLQKGLFYVAEHDGNAETGFLVFLPGAAVVFVSAKPKGPPPCLLRMRVSPHVSECGGSILVASLDSVQHTLRLEDVFKWRGEPLFDSQPYSQRRERLREFVENFWIPDARLLGGIAASIMNPLPLEEGLQKAATGMPHVVELIPEQAGRRRLWFQPGLLVQPVTATAAAAAVAVAAPKHRRAYARPVESMPDIYDLYDEKNAHIGRASVQRFSTSQMLRSHRDSSEGIPVQIEWRSEFNGYEICGILPT